MKKVNVRIATKQEIKNQLKGLSYSEKRITLINNYIITGKIKDTKNFSMKKAYERVQNQPLTALIKLTVNSRMM